MEFIPNSVLLNNVFSPFLNEPKREVFNTSVTNQAIAKDGSFTLEMGSNGITSVIDLSINDPKLDKKPIVPYVDLSKYDPESKDWYWYDEDGFPYRMFYDLGLGKWVATALWPINNYGESIKIDPSNLTKAEDGPQLGFYVNGVLGEETVKLYTGRPLILEIDGEVITDNTIYGSVNITTGLTDLNTDVNKEFYYDEGVNKIYTNQNLLSVDSTHIKVYLYTVPNEVSVKCRMSSNSGTTALVTPTVDYYVVKLNGQNLRG